MSKFYLMDAYAKSILSNRSGSTEPVSKEEFQRLIKRGHIIVLDQESIEQHVRDSCSFYVSGDDTSGNCNNCGKPQNQH